MTTTPPPEMSARERILWLLKTRGPQTAGALARSLGVTAMAVRQQLARLADEDLVHYREERRPVGRPAHVYRLTERAQPHFPDGHGELAVDLLDAMQDAFGADGLRHVIAARTQRQRTRYAQRIDPCAPLATRLEALRDLRTSEGYLAELATDAQGNLLLIENHCPICDAAKRCRALCTGELELFRDVLGPDVDIERTEHILGGQRRCVYRITPT